MKEYQIMTIILVLICYINLGDIMKVKVFDEDCEKDLENSINCFLNNEVNLVDIKYQVAIAVNGEEQLYCFSAMIIYY